MDGLVARAGRTGCTVVGVKCAAEAEDRSRAVADPKSWWRSTSDQAELCSQMSPRNSTLYIDNASRRTHTTYYPGCKDQCWTEQAIFHPCVGLKKDCSTVADRAVHPPMTEAPDATVN